MFNVGDLARIKYRDLIYTTRRGGDCIGAADKGDIVVVIDDNKTSRKVKIFHLTHGIGFITRYYVEAINVNESQSR